MSNENSITLVGNMTRDPELRFTPGGMAVANFGIAVNKRRQDKGTQEWIEETSFFDVTVFDKLAENVSESLTRGTRVVVFGELQQRSWETNEGDKRSKIEVNANEVCASLRWATVDVTKNERGDDDRSKKKPASRPAPAKKKTETYDDTEPF